MIFLSNNYEPKLIGLAATEIKERKVAAQEYATIPDEMLYNYECGDKPLWINTELLKIWLFLDDGSIWLMEIQPKTVSDHGSVPALVLRRWIDDDGKYLGGTYIFWIHDMLYWLNCFTRKEADDIMGSGMNMLCDEWRKTMPGYSKFNCWTDKRWANVAYTAVRLGGQPNYAKPDDIREKAKRWVKIDRTDQYNAEDGHFHWGEIPNSSENQS